MKNWSKLITGYIVIFIICVVAIYVIPSVRGMLERTYIASPGKVELAYDVDGYVVRDEVVYLSDSAGSVNRLAKSGELVKGGATVVEITGSGNNELEEGHSKILNLLGDSAKTAEKGITGRAGYISYTADGGEGRLCRDNLDKLTEAMCREYTSVSDSKLADGKCAAGEPLFKTTKNGEWWVVFFTDEEGAKAYEEGDSVRITIDGESARAYVKSVNKVSKDKQYRVILKCNVFLKGYLEMRRVKVTVTTESATGLVIDKESIVTRNKQQGVLIKNKLGTVVFKPIMIKADDGTRCAVCEDYYMDGDGNFVETLKVYDEVIKSPTKDEIKESE